MVALSINKSYILLFLLPLSTPTPVVLLPCGSKSTNKTFLPYTPNDADKLILVVVFPTPPF